MPDGKSREELINGELSAKIKNIPLVGDVITFVNEDRRFGHRLSSRLANIRFGVRGVGQELKGLQQRITTNPSPKDVLLASIAVSGSIIAISLFDSAIKAVNNTRLTNALIKQANRDLR